MITDYFSDLNWLAVLVAAVAWFIFSAIWYSIPAMSRTWQKAAKVDPDDGGSFAVSLVVSFLCYVVTTIAVALLVAAMGTDTVNEALALGLVLGVGFGLTSALVSQVYENKGKVYGIFNGLNAIIAMCVVAVILVSF